MKPANDGWSMGEIRALAEKATRGAGFDWSIAEEAGFAVLWLETSGAPGCQALASYLSDLLSDTAATAKCPLRLGTQLLDYNTPHPIKLGLVRYPLLLAPFIAAYALEPCKLQWPGAEVFVLQKSLHTGATEQAILQPQAICDTAKSNSDLPPTGRLTRVNPDRQTAVLQLQALSQKTYAPATEASRSKGAG